MQKCPIHDFMLKQTRMIKITALYTSSYTSNTVQKLPFMKFSSHQGCIYLITTKRILCNITMENIVSNIVYFCDAQLYFQHHYSSLQCHMIFRNHNNILICCSKNISDYYPCCPIFLWKPRCLFLYLILFIFFRIFDE